MTGRVFAQIELRFAVKLEPAIFDRLEPLRVGVGAPPVSSCHRFRILQAENILSLEVMNGVSGLMKGIARRQDQRAGDEISGDGATSQSGHVGIFGPEIASSQQQSVTLFLAGSLASFS
jgi:hypothetical protein